MQYDTVAFRIVSFAILQCKVGNTVLAFYTHSSGQVQVWLLLPSMIAGPSLKRGMIYSEMILPMQFLLPLPSAVNACASASRPKR